MRARLLKEARGLSPAWIAAYGLILAPLAVSPPGLWLTLLVLGFSVGCLTLASTAFGREFDNGTFGLLLAQPVSRWRLWWEKTGLLAIALASVSCALPLAMPAAVVGSMPLVFAGIVLAAYGGGLLFALLVRQTLGAVCLSAAVPFFLCVFIILMWEVQDGSEAALSGAMAVQLWWWGAVTWSAVSYAVALLLFLRREDVVPSSGLAVIGRRLRSARRPAARIVAWRALLWKELHLQQWGIFLGLALLLLAALAWPLRALPTRPGSVPHLLVRAPVILMGLLSWIVPIVLGLTTITEERRMGTWAWQRSLPVGHMRGLLLKLCVAWGLTLVFTPWLPIVMGRLFGLSVPLFVLSSVLLLFAFYGSSLARSFVEAFLISVGAAAALLLTARMAIATGVVRLMTGWEEFLLALFATPVILAGLAVWNARETVPSRRLRLINLAALIAVCLGVFCFAILYGVVSRF